MTTTETSSAKPLLAILLALVFVAGCDNIENASARTTVAPYIPPAPVQLTPPPSVIIEDGMPTSSFKTDVKVAEFAVMGAKFRPIQATLASPDGKRTFALLAGDGQLVEFAEAGFHLAPVATAQTNGDIMICWNTLTGTSSKYSPKAPDPARGMALHCRVVGPDNRLGALERIRVPTVGCWIIKVVALDDGKFRLLFKGDDGWFESDHENDTHGTYEAYFENDKWTTPKLIVPVPDPEQEYPIEKVIDLPAKTDE